MKKKMKTKSSAKKRFVVTASGKIKRRKSGMRHLLEHQTANKKVGKRGTVTVAKADMKKVARMLPN
jgi:large subunit ribosomal protein L35